MELDMTESSLAALLDVINALLGPDGCPWDKEQTPESLGDYILEETFELVDAVRREREGHASAEELGDVFFLLFFLSRLLQDRGQVSGLPQIWKATAEKMKSRHPHVFADTECSTRSELHAKWEEMKKQEKGSANGTEYTRSSMESVPASLPPLLRAYRLHAKAAKGGFTWKSDQEQEAALLQEWAEWKHALASEDQDQLEEEFGDVLFSLVEYGRRRGIKANAALHRSILKFVRRFDAMLDAADEKGWDWSALSMEDKDSLWEEVKREARGQQAEDR